MTNKRCSKTRTGRDLRNLRFVVLTSAVLLPLPLVTWAPFSTSTRDAAGTNTLKTQKKTSSTTTVKTKHKPKQIQLDRVLVDYSEYYDITETCVQDWLKIKHVLLTTDNQM